MLDQYTMVMVLLCGPILTAVPLPDADAERGPGLFSRGERKKQAGPMSCWPSVFRG